LVLAFVVFNDTLTPRQVRRLYRRRFGVESGYRCRRKARARTASRNPALRFLLMGLGFILVNLTRTSRNPTGLAFDFLQI
jgi:IS4 transposase